MNLRIELICLLFPSLIIWNANATPELAGTDKSIQNFKKLCSDQKRESIFTGKNWPEISCSLEFNDRFKNLNKSISIVGKPGSNVLIDCKGGSIGDINQWKTTAIYIQNYRKKEAEGEDEDQDGTPYTNERIQNVRIQNCKVYGRIMVVGHGVGIEKKMKIEDFGEDLKKLSRRKDFSKFLRSIAPTNIQLHNIEVNMRGWEGIYIGSGVTHFQLTDSRLYGSTGKYPSLYLDSESRYNLIKDNQFQKGQWNDEIREVIAIDGSAYNTIINNVFENPKNGGIFLYRNCGERGVIRHQSPQYNFISNNRFIYPNIPNPKNGGYKAGIWVASRDGKSANGFSNWCDHDSGFDFGSSRSDKDFAHFNVIVKNTYTSSKNLPEKAFLRLDDQPNQVEKNIEHHGFYLVNSMCYVRDGFPKDLVSNGREIVATIGKGDLKPQRLSSTLYCNDGILERETQRITQKEFDDRTHLRFLTANPISNGKFHDFDTDLKCPSGFELKKYKLACNLEWGIATKTHLSGIHWNHSNIILPDNDGYGRCQITDPRLGQRYSKKGHKHFSPSSDRDRINIKCSDYDSNGGECSMAAYALCFKDF